MKRVVLAIAAAAFLITIGVIQASPTLASGAAASVAAPDDQKAPPPPGVSPADPAMDLPHMDGCCGACCCAERHRGAWQQKGRMGRPELGSGRGHHMEGQAPGQCAKADRSRPGRYGRAGERECCGAGKCGGMHAGLGGPGRHGGVDQCDPRGGLDGRGMRGGFDGAGPRGGIPAERMLRNAEALKLSDEQIATLEKLSFETQKTLVDLHAVIEKGQLEIRNSLQSGNDDLAAIKGHLAAVSQARADIQAARIANLFEARKVLTEKQKKAIKEDFPRLGTLLD